MEEVDDRSRSFTVVEEPAYEWLGTRVEFDPEHGMFSADCDSDGDVVVYASTIDKAIAQTATHDELVAKLHELTGTKPAQTIQGGA